MKIQHWFIPSRKNKFHPKALRPSGLLVFLAIFLAITPLYNLISTGRPQVLGYATSIFVESVASLSNQERINNGLPALATNSALSSAAYAKAMDMFADNYWAHNAPDGATPWSFIIAAGYDYNSAGENLAKDFNTSAGVVAGWMASPGHKANILGSTYTDAGYAVVNGVLLGSETTLVVAMYGSKVTAEVAVTEPAVTTNTPVTTTASSDTTPTTTVQETTPQQQITPYVASSTANPDTTTTTETPTETAIDKPSETINIEASPATNSTEQLNTIASIDQTNEENGSVAGWFASLPVQAYKSLNIGQKVSLLLIATLSLLFVMKHTMIWREQKRGLKNIWLRAHPIGQATVLIAALIATLINSIGVVI